MCECLSVCALAAGSPFATAVSSCLALSVSAALGRTLAVAWGVCVCAGACVPPDNALPKISSDAATVVTAPSVAARASWCAALASTALVSPDAATAATAVEVAECVVLLRAAKMMGALASKAHTSPATFPDAATAVAATAGAIATAVAATAGAIAACVSLRAALPTTSHMGLAAAVQTDRWTDKQTERQVDRQTQTQTHTQT